MEKTKDMTFRVLVLDDYENLAAGVPAFQALKKRAEVEIKRERLVTEDEFSRALQSVNALLLMRERTAIGEKELAMAPSLKLISQTGRSNARLDVKAATRRAIPVSVTAHDTGGSTFELTVALILALLRHIPQINSRMRQEAWPSIPGRNFEGKTVGIIGLGRIGKQVAQVARAFHARVLATSRTLTDERAEEVGAQRVSLESLLKESDIITIHIPLRPETRGFIGEREFSLMKRGALLVNTARGPLVSQAAMIKALESGQLGGVGLDVYDEEPLPMDHPLRRFENAILMTHRGYATVEMLEERYERAMQNILDFLDGKPLKLMNPEVVERKGNS